MKGIVMANLAALSVLLDRADRVFRVMRQFGQGFTHGIIEVENCDSILDEARVYLSELQDAMQNPPDGFAEVAEQLNRVATLIRIPDADQRPSSSSILSCLLEFGTDGSGAIAVDEAIKRCPAALAEHADRFLTSLDRYPATTRGNIGFLEIVRDDVNNAAEAKRQRLARGYSNATLDKMVDRIMWREARLRTTLLGQLPIEIVQPVAHVLKRDLTVGTVEQIKDLFTPVVRALRESWENRQNLWDSDNSYESDFVGRLLAGPDDAELSPRELAMLSAHLAQPVSLAAIQQEKQATGESETTAKRNKLKLIHDFNRNLRAAISDADPAADAKVSHPTVADSATMPTKTTERGDDGAEAESDDALPKSKRASSQSRIKATAAYAYAIERIPNAHAMTAVELFDAIKKDEEAAAMLPPTAESFRKYLNDCGIRLKKGGPKAAGGSVVQRSDL